MHVFLHKRINYGRKAVCICMQPYLFTFAQLKQLPKLFDLFVKHNSTHLCLTVNSFLKSRLFANINLFKLFDLLKITPLMLRSRSF